MRGGCNSCRNAIYAFLEKNWDALPHEQVNFFIGRQDGAGPPNTYYVGTCGSSRPERNASGHTVAGCPPRPTQIVRALKEQMPAREDPVD